MKQGTEYELFVQEIYRDLNSVDGLENVEIKHDVIIPGTARDHQIDVYWAFTVGGVPYRVVKDGRFSISYLPSGVYAEIREASVCRDQIMKQHVRLSNQIQG